MPFTSRTGCSGEYAVSNDIWAHDTNDGWIQELWIGAFGTLSPSVQGSLRLQFLLLPFWGYFGATTNNVVQSYKTRKMGFQRILLHLWSKLFLGTKLPPQRSELVVFSSGLPSFPIISSISSKSRRVLNVVSRLVPWTVNIDTSVKLIHMYCPQLQAAVFECLKCQSLGKTL